MRREAEVRRNEMVICGQDYEKHFKFRTEGDRVVMKAPQLAEIELTGEAGLKLGHELIHFSEKVLKESGEWKES